MGALAGLATGVTLSSISAVQQAKQRNAEVAALQAAQQESTRQQQALASQAMAQRTAQQQQLNQQTYAMQQQLNSLKRQAAVGKRVVNPGALKDLGTIATSPLGDVSDPNLGKRKLLGN